MDLFDRGRQSPSGVGPVWGCVGRGRSLDGAIMDTRRCGSQAVGVEGARCGQSGNEAKKRDRDDGGRPH
jgi:hypothetical protein